MVRQWLYEDQLNPVAELDGAGNVLWHYVYASREHSPDFLVSDAGAVYRVISDQLGSPRLIVNIANSADVLLEAEYTAFGARTVVSGDPSGVTVGFAGGVFDADTGLTRFGARDYDSAYSGHHGHTNRASRTPFPAWKTERSDAWVCAGL